MALDHYVSQVYLRNFYSNDLGPVMHSIRKSDLEYFTPNSKSVCRIEKGNSNPFLQEERIIEDFLKSVEPNYNWAVSELLNENFEHDVLYTIAGFVAYVLTCSPTGVRIHQKHLEIMLEQYSQMFDAQGKLPVPPEALGGKSFTDLLKNEVVKFEVDPKYPQAIGISNIIHHLAHFANCHWEIIINEYADSKFFTSDFPIGFERAKNPLIINRVIPLSPNIAVRIMPHPGVKGEEPDFEFTKFKYRFVKAKRKDIVEINRLLMRCAEELVFFQDYKDWIFPFVKKNSKYYIKPDYQERPAGNNKYMFFSSRVVEK